MATFGALITEAGKKLIDTSNTSVSAADIASALNDAIRYWKKRRFWFNETSSTITLTEDNADVSWPSDILYELQFFITYNSCRYDIAKVSPNEYDAMNDEGAGMPRFFVYRQQDAKVYPYPDQDYTSTLYYVKDYTDFATDTTQDSLSNDFTTNADHLILYEALSRLHSERRQDERMAEIFALKAQQEYQHLMYQTNRLHSIGRLQFDTII